MRELASPEQDFLSVLRTHLLPGDKEELWPMVVPKKHKGEVLKSPSAAF